MAIYRTGLASMDAQGYVTGTGGTKWREQLTLIRSGATIVFLTSPSSFATISEVISDDRMRVVSSAGKVIPESEYVILIHDSLTVDGLAQDIAETLRYYQGKETQLEAFTDFLKDFDFAKLEQLTNDAKDSARLANESKISAAASEQSALSSSNNAEMSSVSAANSAMSAQQSKESAEISKNSALASAETAKAEADRAHQEVINHKGWKYIRTIEAPSDVDPDKYYPLIISEVGFGDLCKYGLFFQVSTGSFPSSSKYNSCSFAGYCRTSGWSDAVDSLFGNFTSYDTNEKTIYGVALGARVSSSCFAIYVNGGSFPLTFHSENTVNVFVPNGDYIASPGDAINGSVFKYGAVDPESESTLVNFIKFTESGLYTSHNVQARQATAIKVSTSSGVDRDIFITNDNTPGEGRLANFIQGNYQNGYWNFGPIIGNSNKIDYIRLAVNDNAGDVKSFAFKNENGGFISSPRSFAGKCRAGGWGIEWEYLGSAFYADSVTENNSSWSPILSGGTVSSNGFHLKTAFGTITDNNLSWPKSVIKLNGDGKFHRAFEFSHAGGITTWGSGKDSGWNGTFEFSKSPSSDRDIKHDIKYTNGMESYERVSKWLPAMFKYNGQETQRYGFIAQDLLKVDLEYVHLIPGRPIIEDVIGIDDDGKEFVHHQMETGVKDDALCLDINVMFADLACAFIYASNIIENNKNEIELMKIQINELKDAIKNISK